jgi:hypothetical protein
MFPNSVAGNNAVNAFVQQTLKESAISLSTSYVGINRGHLDGNRQYGYDFYVSERMAVFMLDSKVLNDRQRRKFCGGGQQASATDESHGGLDGRAGNGGSGSGDAGDDNRGGVNRTTVIGKSDAGCHTSDFATTQSAIMRSRKSMSIAFGTWTSEVQDVAALSGFGLLELNSGQHLSLFSKLPQCSHCASQRTIPDSELPGPAAGLSYVAFSFSQGDAAGFNQHNNVDYLRTASAVVPGVRVADRYPFSLMEGTLDSEVEPNVLATLRNLSTAQQWFYGKAWGYTNPSAMDNAGHLQEWLRGARGAMDAVGYNDLMTNDKSDSRLATASQIATYMQPPPRSIIQKCCMGTETNACTFTEEARLLGNSTVLLADPVHATPSKNTGDIDVNSTVAAVLASATKRKYFWVFLDHSMTVGALESVLDILNTTHRAKVAMVTIDGLIRVFHRDNQIATPQQW